MKTLISIGPKIRKSVEAQPDGLLLHENLLFSLIPPHANASFLVAARECGRGARPIERRELRGAETRRWRRAVIRARWDLSQPPVW